METSTSSRSTITIRALINAPVSKVWECWNDPKHVTQWNAAIESWHSPRAENDLNVGGRFNYRMEARDGSMGFDFSGVYDRIEQHKLIEYTLDDNRKVSVRFADNGTATEVIETFEAESTNPVEMQRGGWQSILDNFKRYVESKNETSSSNDKAGGAKLASEANKIYPCFWFDNNAKEGAQFYCSVFNAEIVLEHPVVVEIEANGQRFMCLNGGPNFKINPSISMFVVCETEDEVERIWERLGENGSVLMPLDKYDWSPKYGWVQDKFGATWQISLGPISDVGQKFTPSLLFVGDNFGRAEEAVIYYTSVFPNSSVRGVLKYPEGSGKDSGAVMHAQFSINNFVMMAMDSSFDHKFQFNEAVSLSILCKEQEEIDYYWNTLTSDGGQESMCGWLKDKFGVSWQIVPQSLPELMMDPARAERVFKVLMKMRKLDIQALENA